MYHMFISTLNFERGPRFYSIKETMTQRIQFDDVIVLLGGFGKYQKLIYILVVAPALWCAVMTMITVFTVGEQDHR